MEKKTKETLDPIEKKGSEEKKGTIITDFKKLTNVQKQEIFNYLDTFESAKKVKENRNNIQEKFGISFGVYQSLVKDWKSSKIENIDNNVKNLKENVLGFESVLENEFKALSKSGSYSFLCNVAKRQYTGVWEFVKSNYPLMDNETILCKKVVVDRDSKNVFQILAPKNVERGEIAISVLKSSLEELRKNLRNNFNLKQRTWKNQYNTGSILQVWGLDFNPNKGYFKGNEKQEYPETTPETLLELPTLSSLNVEFRKEKEEEETKELIESLG